jgi:hypothetical protein
VRPSRLNASIATLFMVGAACFALGAVPAYASAVGGLADGVTFFVGSLFFTSASLLQLVQAQSPEMAPGGRATPGRLVWLAWLPRDRNWLAAATQFPGTLAFNVSTAFALAASLTAAQEHRVVWRPDFVGSVLFLAASTLAILALGKGFFGWEPRSTVWRIAWLNMIGSIAFMASAIASLVVPSTGQAISVPVANGGTFAGAVCFFLGAALMLPAWAKARQAGG